jgi:integrase
MTFRACYVWMNQATPRQPDFKKLLRKAGLPPMRPYDIRHSFATLWIESGESAEVLQKVLGHSSIATTINTYSHLSPRYQRESFGRFGDALGGR